MEVISRADGNGEKWKMFSHWEHAFPTLPGTRSWGIDQGGGLLGRNDDRAARQSWRISFHFDAHGVRAVRGILRHKPNETQPPPDLRIKFHNNKNILIRFSSSKSQKKW
jgi:hypothetical protein